jgi:hypothetical protein
MPRESEPPSPAPTRTGPRGTSGSPATSSFNRRAPSRMPAAFAASLAPAAVSLFPRPSRAKRGTPNSRSRAFTVIVTAGCDFCRAGFSSNEEHLPGRFQRGARPANFAPALSESVRTPSLRHKWYGVRSH